MRGTPTLPAAQRRGLEVAARCQDEILGDSPRRTAVADLAFITYETLDDGRIVRIMLNRPDARNAQNRGLLVELNDAFLRAEADDTVRVVILGGVGPMFSSGHDMGSEVQRRE